MSYQNNTNQWSGPNGANAEEFRKAPSGDFSGNSSAQKAPFSSGKSGPPVFYRSKNVAPSASQDDSQRETEAPRVSNPPPQPVQSK